VKEWVSVNDVQTNDEAVQDRLGEMRLACEDKTDQEDQKE
jgi:hypothetical protein